jgi:hypothetical protein
MPLADSAAPDVSHADGELGVAAPSALLIELVTRHGLSGDPAAMCTAACVSRGWRDGTAYSALWEALGPLPPRAAARLTDALLLTLVARARDKLRRIDLCGCVNISDAGLAAALAEQPLLTHLRLSGCYALTAAGVAAALAGTQLAELWVHGVLTTDDGDDDAAELALVTMRSLAAASDVSGVCDAEPHDDGVACLRLCSAAAPPELREEAEGPEAALPARGAACSCGCGRALCAHCCDSGRLPACRACGKVFCTGCAWTRSPGLNVCGVCRGVLCDDCEGWPPHAEECSWCGTAACCAMCAANGERRFRCDACDSPWCSECMSRCGHLEFESCGSCGIKLCGDCVCEKMVLCDFCEAWRCGGCQWQWQSYGEDGFGCDVCDKYGCPCCAELADIRCYKRAQLHAALDQKAYEKVVASHREDQEYVCVCAPCRANVLPGVAAMRLATYDAAQLQAACV